VSATASNGTISVLLGTVRWVDAQTVKAVVPAGLPPGLYSVTLTLPRGDVVSLADALTLTDALEDDAGVVTPCDVTTLLDGDHDGFGAPGSEAQLCGPGRVDAGGDCNDLDALASPVGLERCNGFDDDCDTAVDEGVCTAAVDGGGLFFRRVRTLEDGDNDFVAVSAWGPASAWLVVNDKLFVHASDDAGFVERSNNCPPRMNAVWADPTGRAFVAGGNPGIGRIAIARPQQGCSASQLLPEPVAALRGFALPDGGAQAEALLRDGRRAAWDGTGTPRVVGTPSGTVLVTGDAATRASFFGAGRTATNTPTVVRVRSDGTSTSENLATLGAVPPMRGASATGSFEVVVVGDQGSVERRAGGVWAYVGDAGTANDFFAVKAFSAGRFYVSGAGGQVRVWNGAWTTLPTDPVTIRAIDGVDEEHLWLVGDNGVILRRP
jgi:hypothetical protein